MADEACRAYFIARGWPARTNGKLKGIAELDKGELIALARKHAIMLQVEFGQIVVPPPVMKDRAR
jgi:hypothetical protein